ALACAEHCRMRRVVVGRDMRLSSPPLAGAIIAALLGRGVDVVDIGLCGTEEVYHAVFSGAAAGVDGGIMVTASHNPADYNGMKIVRAEARPLSGDTGLAAVAGLAADEDWCRRTLAEIAPVPGTCTRVRDKGAYIDHLLALVDPVRLRPLEVASTTVHNLLGLVGIMVVVGILNQTMTLTGARGLLSLAVVTLPVTVLFATLWIILPVSEGVLQYAVAPLFGVPLIMLFNMLGLNPVISLASWAVMWPLGDCLPPTAVVGRAAVMELGYTSDYYRGFVRTALVPMLVILAMCTAVMIYSRELGALIGG
ncbi:MAG: hypothetical protein EOM10_16865, partial [Opitutae bacterium]|nr:hypothetical protein [Opitutae bacterium]